MATCMDDQVQTLTEETLTEIERNLGLKERQLINEYNKTNINTDIRQYIEKVKILPKPLTDLEDSLKSNLLQIVEECGNKIEMDINIAKSYKSGESMLLTTVPELTPLMHHLSDHQDNHRRVTPNNYLIKKTEPMSITSTISDDTSLANLIKTLDKASSILPSLHDELALSRIHRADVLIKSSNDAWIYSLNPTENLILPKKRKDIQTTCRICSSEVHTNSAPTTDFLLCGQHQENLDRFAKTIKSIYGSESDAQPPVDRIQFHQNLYGPVLNRLNILIQQLKTKATESKDPSIKVIYEIMIDTNIMFKASFILYERYLNPVNMESFFNTILMVLNFAVTHETEIINGLQTVQNISSRVLELCLTIIIKLFVLTRIVLQIFFDSFAIVFNTIYKNIIAHAMCLISSITWQEIIERISQTIIECAVIVGAVYLMYKIYKNRTTPEAINFEIEKEDLIIG